MTPPEDFKAILLEIDAHLDSQDLELLKFYVKISFRLVYLINAKDV